MRTLILDNYDSFAFNLAQGLAVAGSEVEVRRNDAVSLAWVEAQRFDRIVLSPGPGDPTEPARFGVCSDVVRACAARVPMLGVCLGHQGIGALFGARVVRAPEPRHGKTSTIVHRGGALFDGIAPRFVAMRYHSLMLEPSSLPASLEAMAHTEDGVVMALRHRSWPLWGVQFHPESIGTTVGPRLLGNFLAEAIKTPAARCAAASA